MNTKPDRDLSRLPRWARWEIERLRLDLKAANARADIMGGKPSRVSYGYEHAGPTGYIPPGAVHFVLGEEQSIHADTLHATIEEDREGLFLRVHGSDQIAIRPMASNSFEVRMLGMKARTVKEP